MNMIQFTHFGQPCNVYFRIDGDAIAGVKVTSGPYNGEGFDLTERDMITIEGEIAREIYWTAQEFLLLGKQVQA